MPIFKTALPRLTLGGGPAFAPRRATLRLSRPLAAKARCSLENEGKISSVHRRGCDAIDLNFHLSARKADGIDFNHCVGTELSQTDLAGGGEGSGAVKHQGVVGAASYCIDFG